MTETQVLTESHAEMQLIICKGITIIHKIPRPYAKYC